MKREVTHHHSEFVFELGALGLKRTFGFRRNFEIFQELVSLHFEGFELFAEFAILKL